MTDEQEFGVRAIPHLKIEMWGTQFFAELALRNAGPSTPFAAE
jgi:hypothetical protein